MSWKVLVSLKVLVSCMVRMEVSPLGVVLVHVTAMRTVISNT